MDANAAFTVVEGGSVRCQLCPHNCLVEKGNTGKCLTRRNIGGQMTSLTYGRLSATAVDPIEKKPLFHFRPGSSTFSIASTGCNLTCPFCQNHTLSQALHHPNTPLASRLWPPQEVVKVAMEQSCSSISFTYSEPILQFEFARDVAVYAQKSDIALIFVTNGQTNKEPTLEMAEFIAAANVDLKCFVPSKYKDILGGSLPATTRTIETFASSHVWVEVTTLVIPGFNDSDRELRDIARYVAGINPEIPWHVSRFHPSHHWLDRPSTPIQTLKRAREIGFAEGLRYVYVGNLHGDVGEKTFCPSCGSPVVDRRGYRVQSINMQNGACEKCAEKIAGVGFP